MFRNPRENNSRPTSQYDPPSTGRPPTPPNKAAGEKSFADSSRTSPYFFAAPPSPMAGGAASIAKSQTTPAPKKAPWSSNNKRSSSTKKNTSILSFFKKTDAPQPNQPRITQFGVKISRTESDSGSGDNSSRKASVSQDNQPSGGLFLEDDKRSSQRLVDIRDGHRNSAKQVKTERTKTPDYDTWDNWHDLRDEDEGKFNENGGSNKRRKVESPPPPPERKNSDPRQRKGPFIDESDSENEDSAEYNYFDTVSASAQAPEEAAGESPNISSATPTAVEPPSLVRAATSKAEEDSDDAVADDFDDIEDELEGEDFMERPWMEEEAQAFGILEDDAIIDTADDTRKTSEVSTCPICQTSLAGLSDSEASVHVNGCLDGNPMPLPTKIKSAQSANGLTRLDKATIARPAQRNPFAAVATGVTSAFSKLMAGHAEDSAWVAAAANETASRGKQAYERTCPFYKILPGLYITVDAFRYGSVEGCAAYFLSHFHSDHYGGLTSSWRHGRIYCSRVTGNLVRQQLKVDPKWVLDLEFEQKTEIPDTKGVYVTMIPANHCPGSSLFLFEKGMPGGRQQRVLHCGDFRACPAHVQHPLLRPDVVDSVSGRQQRIDVCYLDTTYLSPKYAFPGQEDVISACADMCVRLSDDHGDKTEALDFHKQGSEVNQMSKFLANGVEKVEPSAAKDDVPSVSRGRLLVVIGTYSIGKERICLGIARALKCKIYAPPQKQRICACLEDPELSSLLTDDPLEAQIHMQILFEIRAETLADYLQTLKPHFSRVVGFRPTGWTYRPPGGRLLDNPPVSNVLHSSNWKTAFSVQDLVPQRGSTKESSCFGVPYSEHSSFRELTMFCCALRIGRVIPTVNVGSPKSRAKMKAWFERWEAEKRKSGLFAVEGETW